MLALVDTKRDEFLHDLDVVDGYDLMESDVTKWSCISKRVWHYNFLLMFVMEFLARVSGT